MRQNVLIQQVHQIVTRAFQRKRDNIVKSGASVVSTGCPACMMQISDMLSQNGDNVRVKHPIEIYAESLPD